MPIGRVFMADIKRSRPKHPVEMRVPKVEFIGEKDGPPEKLLKERLAELFQGDAGVKKAYLARVCIGEQVGVEMFMSVVRADSERRAVAFLWRKSRTRCD
jgi:hypothetical protein